MSLNKGTKQTNQTNGQEDKKDGDNAQDFTSKS